MRRCARTLRRPAHRPCPHPPYPAPLSPPDAHATLVSGPVAALSPRPRARCRVRIGALYLPQQEDRRTLSAPSGACYAPHDLNSCVGPAHLMCILTGVLFRDPLHHQSVTCRRAPGFCHLHRAAGAARAPTWRHTLLAHAAPPDAGGRSAPRLLHRDEHTGRERGSKHPLHGDAGASLTAGPTSRADAPRCKISHNMRRV